MKEVVRQSMFETNSSSSHAVSIRRKKADEQWRTAKNIAATDTDNYVNCDEKEIRSAYEKMMLVWGLECEDHYLVVPYQCLDEVSDEAKEFRDHAVASHERFKNILLDECAKVQAFNKVEAVELMDDCTMHGYAHRLCCRFFNEDVLDECTCGLSIGKIAEFLGLNSNDFGEKFEREFARRIFADDVYFVTKEGFCGGCWHINKVIF